MFEFIFLLIIISLISGSVYFIYKNKSKFFGTKFVKKTEDTQSQYAIVGELIRQWRDSTPYVIDPVDNDIVYLNTKDDMYEDGDGNIWKLI